MPAPPGAGYQSTGPTRLENGAGKGSCALRCMEACKNLGRWIMETVDYLRGEEVVRLLEIADAEGAREALMVRIPLYTGARIGEVSPLAVGDCEIAQGRIKLSKVCFVPAELATKSKGSDIYDQARPVTLLLEDEKGFTGKKVRMKPPELLEYMKKTGGFRHECVKEGLKASQPTRVVPFVDGRSRQMLADWIRGHESREFVFGSQKGGRLEKQQIQRTVSRLMREAEISEDKCYPHMLRHTYAVHFLKKNPGAIFQLARILGHTSIKTTTIYLRFVVEDLQALLQSSGNLFDSQ